MNTPAGEFENYGRPRGVHGNRSIRRCSANRHILFLTDGNPTEGSTELLDVRNRYPLSTVTILKHMSNVGDSQRRVVINPNLPMPI